ncbi:MAG: amidohydrolase [Candidatus Rokubacteria bacterium]|nr:amidohydrolase [Candidatus Rokubacteria bacterium]
MIKAIDVHAHISTAPWHRSTRKFVEAMRVYYRTEQPVKAEDEMAQDFIRARVKGCIIAWDAEAGTGEPKTPNDYIADLVRKYPEAYAGGWAMVDPWKGQMALQEIERAIKELKLLGVKFQQSAQAFFPDDHRFYPIWDLCQSLGVPVQFHTGTTGLGAGCPGGLGVKLKYTKPIPHLDDVAADFPRLTIIACHVSWPWQEEMLAVLLHKANVVMETSGWAPKYFPESLKREINGRLQDKVMFGSDYPVLTHERLFREFEAEGYKAEVLEKIYLKNPQRILGIKV